MNIGKFQLDESGVFTGVINTFAGGNVQVRIAPTDLTGIDYIATVKGTEIELGVAWNAVGKEKGTRYVSIKFDLPFLPSAAYCSLFEQRDGSYNLVWTRPDPKKAKKNQPAAEQDAA